MSRIQSHPQKTHGN